MHRYKPDIMTLLVWLVAISFVATTSVHANEVTQAYGSRATNSILCVNAWKDIKTCVSTFYPSSYSAQGYTHGGSAGYLSGYRMEGEFLSEAGMFNMNRFKCQPPTHSQALHSQLAKTLFGEDFPDMDIAISHNLAIDFGVGADDQGKSLSSIYFAYKACW